MVKKMKVLVTGSNGCIGKAATTNLIDRSFEVVGVDTYMPADPVPGVEYAVGSILDKTFMRDAMQDCDAVVHLAAHLGVKRTEVNRLRCIEINIDGTKVVLDAAHASRSVNKFVFASSSEVYGEPLENPITEDSITQGKTIYAISKLAGEQLVLAYQRELKAFDTNILRLFNTYGRGQVGQFAISKCVEAVLLG